MTNQQIHSQSQSVDQPSPPRSEAPNRGLAVILLLVALGGTAVLLELYGVTNVIPNFGEGGRPLWQVGWQLEDVPPEAPAASSIQTLVEADIVSGYPNDEFRPEQPITRAEFAAMVSAAFVEQPSAIAADYTDVPADFWGRDAIASATRGGFMNGYPDNSFRPQQPITRAEAAIALVQGLNLETDPSSNILDRYDDADAIPEAARPAVATAAAAGLLEQEESADSQRLQPNQSLTRAEAAQLIAQTREYLQ